MVIKCAECKKPRLIHSQKKMKMNECNAAKHVLSGLECVCGSSFREFLVDKNNRDATTFERAYVRENISCSLNIKLP